MATYNPYHPCWLWDVYCNNFIENEFWKLDRATTRPNCILLCQSPIPSCWRIVHDREFVGRLTVARDIDWRRWMASCCLIPHAKRLTAIYISISHYSDVIMSAMASQTSASRLFTQPFIQTPIKENTKAARHWPLWGEFNGDRWIPRTKVQ